MRLLIAAALLTACWPGIQSEKHPLSNPKLQDFAAELSQAARARNVGKIRGFLRGHIVLGGLWFDDVKCMTKFAAPARLDHTQFDALARCLATLDLAPSTRTDQMPDVAVLTYGPGLELEAHFVETREGPWLDWIGYVARRDLQDALPTVTGAALEALRIEGDAQAPLAGPGAFDELTTQQGAHAWIKVCIDSSGAVTGAHVRQATSLKAARIFAAATQTWKFKPFILRSQPAPVCAMILMRYPSTGTAKEALPLPVPEGPDERINIASGGFGKLVGGVKHVAPDDDDKTSIHKSRIKRVFGAVHYCIDETGRVAHAALIRSTGFSGYDAKLVSAVRTWAYKPYLDEGKPVSVCSSAFFIYSQM